MSILHKSFEEIYIPKIKQFEHKTLGMDISGIPMPHLPHWGTEYETAPIRVGFIGIETRGWGEMCRFISAAKTNPRESLYLEKKDFDSFEFTNWTNRFGTSFWDTNIKILAGLYGVADWKDLKRKTNTDPLKRFFWANVNSIENFDVTAKWQKVQYETWNKVKKASECFDSLRMILDVLCPHVVFIFCQEPSQKFLDVDLDWTNFGKCQDVAKDSKTGCLVFSTPHPTWLNFHQLHKEVVIGLIDKARKELHIH